MDAPRETQAFAKTLRRRMSLPEVLLWRELRRGQLDGLQFRKQHPIGPYVLDFYCAAARLAIEVDGQGHGVGDQPARDERRDQWLADQGIRTFRLRAGYVLETPWNAAQMVLVAARGQV